MPVTFMEQRSEHDITDNKNGSSFVVTLDREGVYESPDGRRISLFQENVAVIRVYSPNFARLSQGGRGDLIGSYLIDDDKLREAVNATNLGNLIGPLVSAGFVEDDDDEVVTPSTLIEKHIEDGFQRPGYAG